MAAFFLGGSMGYAALMVPVTLALDAEAKGVVRLVSDVCFCAPPIAMAVFTRQLFRKARHVAD
jgi:hypothetical protein